MKKLRKDRGVAPPPEPSSGPDALRRRAEQRLRERHARGHPAPGEADGPRLVHELQVHQIELEMQNEELRQARDALESALERYRDLYDFAPVAYLTLNRDATILESNLAAATLLGIERSRLLNCDFARQVAPPDRAGFRSFLGRIAAGGSREVCETTLLPEGRPAISVLIEAAMAASGEEFRVALTDITERNAAERDRLVLGKLESTGILAGGIAHDFNNLLTVILLDIERVEALAPPHEPALLLAEARQAALSARSLTRQLITFASGGEPVRTVTHLAEVIQESVRLPLSGSRVRCDLEVARDLWPVEVDVGQIQQVIRNLVLNAREAMREGGVVTVRAENVTLATRDGSSPPPGDYVRVSVVDRGHGMSQDVLARIFDPYFSTKQRGSGKGMGLGLTISHAIVRKHGGAIGVASEFGVGTTFHVDLPARPKAPGEKPPASPAEATASPLRILVMDDDDAVRKVVGDSLQRLGHAVELAADGRQAIDLYRQARDAGLPFDLVFLDLTVRNGLGGRETLPELRTLDPQVRAVVMSGYADDAAMRDPERLGFVGVLAKPFDGDRLQQLISRLMDRGTDREAAR